jgi:hypothetical protein
MKFFTEKAELIDRKTVVGFGGTDQEEITIKLTLKGRANTTEFSTWEVLKIVKERLKQIKSDNEKVNNFTDLSFARDNVMNVIDYFVSECDIITPKKQV